MADSSAPTAALELLSVFLSETEAAAESSQARAVGLPSAGTLPRFSMLLGGGPAAEALSTSLRSLGQVIFINNPISGLLLLLALALQSASMALLAALAIVAANLTARWIGADVATRRLGIHGFNGALVGAVVAAFADLSTAQGWLSWAIAAAAGAGLTTLLVESLGRWMVQRLGLAPLTLPFCLVSWLLLALAGGPARSLLHLGPATIPVPESASWPLPLGVVHGFGQVFLCPSLASSVLVLAAVAAASPLAAGIGLLGGLASSLTAQALGMEPAAVIAGLGSYNGVLCSIAIAGIFHAPAPTSLVVGLLTAAVSALVAPPLASLLTPAQLPVLTAPFVLATLLALLLVRRTLPSVLPVAIHALLTPEEHRQRLRVSRTLLGDFRRRLGQRLAGERSALLLPRSRQAEREALARLFAGLDRDGDGRLSLEELAAGLRMRSGAAAQEGLPAALLESADLDGDSAVNSDEFAELMLRLRQLIGGRERLRTYLQPVDADGNDQLDPSELDRLLRSVGQAPLSAAERQHLFAPHGGALSWSGLLDRLLLT